MPRRSIRPATAALDPALGPLSTYEIGVALGMTFFAERQVEAAVLEIGLGGRYDAVNTVTPLVSVITAISYDHTATLSDDHETFDAHIYALSRQDWLSLGKL